MLEFIEQTFYGIILLAIVVAPIALVIRALAKAGLRRMEKAEKKYAAKNNLFVIAHQQMLKEEALHKEYLEWMDKNNVPGVPFERPISHEQRRADEKIKRLIN